MLVASELKTRVESAVKEGRLDTLLQTLNDESLDVATLVKDGLLDISMLQREHLQYNISEISGPFSVDYPDSDIPQLFKPLLFKIATLPQEAQDKFFGKFKDWENSNQDIVKYFTKYDLEDLEEFICHLIKESQNGNSYCKNALIAKHALALPNKTTTLALASVAETPRAIQALISFGACPDEIDDLGRTPLMYAAMEGRLENLKALITPKTNINQKDNEGTTPLFFAIQRGHEDTALYLISIGADLNIKNNEDKEALDFITDPKETSQYTEAFAAAKRKN